MILWSLTLQFFAFANISAISNPYGMRKYFCIWITGPDGLETWKNKGQKSCDTLSLLFRCSFRGSAGSYIFFSSLFFPRLMGSFDTQSGIPFSDVNLKTRLGHAPKWSPDSSTSEVTTIQLEFRDLSRSTGNPMYEDAVSRVSELVHALDKASRLFSLWGFDVDTYRQLATFLVDLSSLFLINALI